MGYSANHWRDRYPASASLKARLNDVLSGRLAGGYLADNVGVLDTYCLFCVFLFAVGVGTWLVSTAHSRPESCSIDWSSAYIRQRYRSIVLCPVWPGQWSVFCYKVFGNSDFLYQRRFQYLNVCLSCTHTLKPSHLLYRDAAVVRIMPVNGATALGFAVLTGESICIIQCMHLMIIGFPMILASPAIGALAIDEPAKRPFLESGLFWCALLAVLLVCSFTARHLFSSNWRVRM